MAISFHFFSLSLCSWGWIHFVVVGVDCSWVYVWLLSFCLWKFLYVPSMLFHVFKEIKIVPSQIYNFFIKTKIICVIRGNLLFSACPCTWPIFYQHNLLLKRNCSIKPNRNMVFTTSVIQLLFHICLPVHCNMHWQNAVKSMLWFHLLSYCLFFVMSLLHFVKKVLKA